MSDLFDDIELIPFDLEDSEERTVLVPAADLSKSLKDHELEFQRDKNQRERDLHKLRQEYIPVLFNLNRMWIVILIGMLLLAGFKPWGFDLPPSVLIAFITTTTATILGSFAAGFRWLFPN